MLFINSSFTTPIYWCYIIVIYQVLSPVHIGLVKYSFAMFTNDEECQFTLEIRTNSTT